MQLILMGVIAEIYHKYSVVFFSYIAGTSSSNSSENQITSWDLWRCAHGFGIPSCLWRTVWPSRWVSWWCDFRQVSWSFFSPRYVTSYTLFAFLYFFPKKSFVLWIVLLSFSVCDFLYMELHDKNLSGNLDVCEDFSFPWLQEVLLLYW